MARALPALRRNLDLMPSPVPEQPGLLIRDPFRYSDTMIVVPPLLVPCLTFFDGGHDEGDVKAALVRMTGDVRAAAVVSELEQALSGAGFLDDPPFAARRDERHQAFAAASVREAAHAGSAYPEEKTALRETFGRYLEPGDAGRGAREANGLVAIAAPHVSPEGGWRSYGAAYRALGPEHASRTFVILGTSHFGEPETFGLTRKPFRTPYGDAPTDPALVEELAGGGPAVRMEDYCHAVEHSIEFQVVFLQHVLGPGVRIVPVLCGPFARATAEGGLPDADPGVARFLETLRDAAARRREGLLFVLGVDMAHMGRRYGDPFRARADLGTMTDVAERDARRLERIQAGDAAGFWALVQKDGDDLKWCGASPLYTFLRSVAPVRGELLRYEQWNIDEHSVVSFAGLAFRHAPAAEAGSNQ